MTASIALASPVPAAATASGSSANSTSSDSGFSFHDLLSIINPLQHIPVVSTIYRALTGDTIRPAERIAGDTLYGGFWGFVSSVANVAFQEVTGKDFGDTALAFLEGDDTGTTALAANTSSASTTTGNGSLPNGAAVTPPALASTAPAGAASTTWLANGPPRSLQPQQTLAAARPASANAPAADTTAGARVASGPPRSLQPQAALSTGTADNAASLALMSAMTKRGIDPALGQRALAAYRKSLAVSPAAAAPVI